jgi:hypothetical protein
MPIIMKGYAGGPPLIEINSHKFKNVHNFTYFIPEVYCKNDISTEIKKDVHFLQVGVFMDLRNI